MKRYRSGVYGLLLFSAVLAISCSKSDPAPLQAQVKARLLAGEAGNSKGWKLIQFTAQSGSNAAVTQTLPGCFADNVYTFSNNAAQTYQATEGVSVCASGYPKIIEQGTWAFTIDGLTVLIGVDQTFSDNGLFSPEAQLAQDPTSQQYYAYPIGYPYPAYVSTLTDTSMVLQINNTVGTTKYVFTLTFVPG
jgi:hypothetical protein